MVSLSPLQIIFKPNYYRFFFFFFRSVLLLFSVSPRTRLSPRVFTCSRFLFGGERVKEEEERGCGALFVVEIFSLSLVSSTFFSREREVEREKYFFREKKIRKNKISKKKNRKKTAAIFIRQKTCADLSIYY